MPDKRLSDSIVMAHRLSCEESKEDIAALLIEALSLELTRIGGIHQDRRDQTDLIEAAFTLHEQTFGTISPGSQKTSI